MGHWGVKSYENDEADFALDAGFERVHAEEYERLMDDRCPLTPEQIQQQLADGATLAAAVEALCDEFPGPYEGWDEVGRLAFAGVVVRHAELGVAVPDDWREQAARWLETEAIEWDELTARSLRREKEIRLLRGS